MARRFAPRRPWQAYDFILDILVRPAILGFVKCCGPSDRLTKFGPAEISADGAVRLKALWCRGGSVRSLWLMASTRLVDPRCRRPGMGGRLFLARARRSELLGGLIGLAVRSSGCLC